MAIIQALVLLTSALLTSGQRPSFAGIKPIGYPELVNRTTTPSALEDKFGEGTTQRLPIEAQGDRELIDRLSKLPIDKQPFWFINWQAYEAHRNKPQTYPQRPNPFLEENLPNPGPINTNTGIVNANSGFVNANPGFVNTNPPQPVITNTINTGNVNTGINPPPPNTNAGQSGLNIKSGDSELGSRYDTESTTFVSTIGPSDTSNNLREPVKTTDANSDGNTKKQEQVVVEPLITPDLNEKNVATISIPFPYYKDTVTIKSDKDRDVVEVNSDTDSNTKKPELAVLEPLTTSDVNDKSDGSISIPYYKDTVTYESVYGKEVEVKSDTDSNTKKPEPVAVEPFTSDINDKNIATISNSDKKETAIYIGVNDEVIVEVNSDTKKPELTAVEPTLTADTVKETVNTPAVSEHSDTVKSSNNDNVELVKSKTDANYDRDVNKPEVKVNPGSLDTNIYFPTFPRHRSLNTPTVDDYEDIEVKKVIKLYPGIIPIYQR